MKWSFLTIALVPPAVVTLTSTSPGLPAGETATSVVALTNSTDAAGVSPNVTVAEAVK